MKLFRSRSFKLTKVLSSLQEGILNNIRRADLYFDLGSKLFICQQQQVVPETLQNLAQGTLGPIASVLQQFFQMTIRRAIEIITE